MSFLRISVLALALAAGLAAPASAATWKIEFFDPVNPTNVVGTGTVVSDVPTSSAPLRFATSLTATINGATYVPIPDFLDPQVSLLNGDVILSALLGTPTSGINIGAFLDDASKSTRTFWESYVCLLPLSGCTQSARGTYTMTRVLDGDPEPPVIPLPATAALLPLGLVALGALRRRKTG